MPDRERLERWTGLTIAVANVLLLPFVLYVLLFGVGLVALGLSTLSPVAGLGVVLVTFALASWAIQPGLWAIATGRYRGRRRLWWTTAVVTALWVFDLGGMAAVVGGLWGALPFLVFGPVLVGAPFALALTAPARLSAGPPPPRLEAADRSIPPNTLRTEERPLAPRAGNRRDRVR